MTRVSKLSSPEDFAIEARREEFRNSRSRRRNKMFLTVSGGTALILGSGGFAHVLAALRALGV